MKSFPNGINDALSLVLSHRHRRTEQEEDEELISQNKHAQTSVVHFDQNPHCKCFLISFLSE